MRTVKGYKIRKFDKIPPYKSYKGGDNTNPSDARIAANTMEPGECVDIRDRRRAASIASNLRATLNWTVTIRDTVIYRIK